MPTANRNRGSSWQKLRAQVIARDGRRCVQCGNTETLTVDHIVELQHGGSDTPANLQTLCRKCHKTKSKMNAPKRRPRSTFPVPVATQGMGR